MNSKSTIKVTPAGAQEMLSQAVAGGFSQSAASLMVEGLNAQTLAGAEGTDPSLLNTDYVTLVCFVLDNTGSMDVNQQAVIDAYNQMVDAMRGSRDAETILLSTWLFNTKSTLLHSYLKLDTVPNLTAREYAPSGLTALFDAVFDAATSTFLYARELRDNQGYQVKVVFVVVTDGWDNESRTHNAADIKLLLSELTDEEIYTFALGAFDTQAFQIGTQMGFLPQNIRNGGDQATAKEWRAFFNMVSHSVIRASQTRITSQTQSFFS